MKETTDIQARFWKRVDKQGDCWLWTGGITRGYGHFVNANGFNYAHRASYEFLMGEIPKGMHLHHTCVNKQCVNPAHLILMTPSDHIKLHRFQRVPRKQKEKTVAKMPRKMVSYRLPAATSDAVRRMADTKQVSQSDIIIEAVRLLSDRLLSVDQKEGTK